MSTTVTIKRVYNNNVVLGHEPDGTEVVLLGVGLGFQRKPGDRVDPTGSQRFVAGKPYKASQVADLLSDATLDEARVAQRIVGLAEQALELKVSQGLLLAVLDHLAFAVRRAAQGVTVDFPLRWEVAQIFPAEAAVGRRAMALVRNELRVELQDDEWVAFALHFINHRWSGGDLSTTISMTETITRTFQVLEHEWGRPIDQNSMSSARFVTHMRYLFVRALEDRQLARGTVDVMAAVRAKYPEAADAAVTIARLIQDAVKRELTPEEVSYLALHTSRLYAEVNSGT